ncbi:MAG: major capsid protein [Arizlama microvirus]|nr:MAG: major capsid protein [Arizlama microvirus]
MMHRNKSVNVHQFAMVPRADIPRSAFKIETAHKTTFDSGKLIPIFCEEILPGDTWKVRMTAFARLATPIFPLMDNIHLDSFFFFVPNRLVWDNWVKFMGEQWNPADSISFLVPYVQSANGGFPVGSIYDYFGLPTVGQVNAGSFVRANSLPLRAYMMIWDEWFRDENLQNAVSLGFGISGFSDGPDNVAAFNLLNRGKRKDYFTGALPWPQKGGTSVSIPLGSSAPVKTNLTALVTGAQPSGVLWADRITGANAAANRAIGIGAVGGLQAETATVIAPSGGGMYPTNLYADLSSATAATINQLRQSFQIQKLLERDARGGTRYTEIVRSHFGVISPDARLQRPEYLGGGSTAVTLSPIAQTSGTGQTGQTTPLGNLAAVGTALAHAHGFSQSFTEHGYVIGLVCARADLNYQQGLRKMWSRSTRYDFYFPAFAMLGEQAILSKEIYADGTAGDETVFGYQERWAEYRYSPSKITGLFRSTSAGTIDGWHLAQRFSVRPTLGDTFIQENPPMSRILAVGAAANGQQFIFDSIFKCEVARPMPLYSVPGMIDHF